jgi:hypothetical protein
VDDILFRFRRASPAAARASNPSWRCHKNKGDFKAMAYVFESVPADRGRIDLNDPREVNWWSKRFGCSPEQLRRAVSKVGNSAAKVEQLLDGKDIMTV